MLDVLGNSLNAVGILLAVSNRPFIDLLLYRNKKLDVFGQSSYPASHSAWVQKYQVPTAILCVVLGNVLLLVQSIFSLIYGLG